MSQPTLPEPGSPRADVGVIGGSGFYEFLSNTERVAVTTPFGDPSDAIVIGTLDGPSPRSVAFVARHGHDHRFAPHRVNYRANLWALRAVGVRQVLAPCAVGSLVADYGPGTIVVPDQQVDRTWGRAHTLYEEPGPVIHVGFADPYCPTGRAGVVEAARAAGRTVIDGGTLGVINGPRFSTRAESLANAAAGWTVVGMTAAPEAGIARELAMCYTNVALVTDHDAGVDAGGAVSHAAVLEAFAANVAVLKQVVEAAAAALPASGDRASGCACGQALDGMTLPFALPE